MTGRGDARTAPSGDTGGQAGATGLFAAWERRTRLWALVWAVLALAVSALVAMAGIRSGQPAAAVLVLALAPAFGAYVWQTRKIRRRRAILREPFPPEWDAVLQRDVVFFRVLEPAAQQRFRRQVQVLGSRAGLDAQRRAVLSEPDQRPDFRGLGHDRADADDRPAQRGLPGTLLLRVATSRVRRHGRRSAIPPAGSRRGGRTPASQPRPELVRGTAAAGADGLSRVKLEELRPPDHAAASGPIVTAKAQTRTRAAQSCSRSARARDRATRSVRSTRQGR